jgi:hypothetical protein
MKFESPLLGVVEKCHGLRLNHTPKKITISSVKDGGDILHGRIKHCSVRTNTLVAEVGAAAEKGQAIQSNQ